MTFENAGPGPATNVSFTDELSPDVEWSIGSGSNVCSIDGTTLSCFAAVVPDGVFEVLEIIGTVDANDCGTYDNTGTVTFEGGPEPGSVSATAPTVEVTGCSDEAPAATDGAGAAARRPAGHVRGRSNADRLVCEAVMLLAAASVLTLRARRGADSSSANVGEIDLSRQMPDDARRIPKVTAAR